MPCRYTCVHYVNEYAICLAVSQSIHRASPLVPRFVLYPQCRRNVRGKHRRPRVPPNKARVRAAAQGNGEELVVVVPNYRLGVFGFAASDALRCVATTHLNGCLLAICRSKASMRTVVGIAMTLFLEAKSRCEQWFTSQGFSATMPQTRCILVHGVLLVRC